MSRFPSLIQLKLCERNLTIACLLNRGITIVLFYNGTYIPVYSWVFSLSNSVLYMNIMYTSTVFSGESCLLPSPPIIPSFYPSPPSHASLLCFPHIPVLPAMPTSSFCMQLVCSDYLILCLALSIPSSPSLIINHISSKQLITTSNANL